MNGTFDTYRVGLFASAGLLVHVGAGALFVLVMLIFCCGLVDFGKTVRWVCNYSAGLYCSLVVSWELSAFGLNHLDWLTFAPGVYLTILGITLLTIATGLSLTRRRLKLVWTEWI